MKLTLANRDPMLVRIDLAYAFNAHMAQGMTADRAIVVMESRDTKLLTRQNFLVSVTRVWVDLTVYVDKADKTKTRLQVQSGEKTSALETTGEAQKQQRDRELQKERTRSLDDGIGRPGLLDAVDSPVLQKCQCKQTFHHCSPIAAFGPLLALAVSVGFLQPRHSSRLVSLILRSFPVSRSPVKNRPIASSGRAAAKVDQCSPR
jgi:hypothetical protein